jgi:hypothetical protein
MTKNLSNTEQQWTNLQHIVEEEVHSIRVRIKIINNWRGYKKWDSPLLQQLQY